MEINEVTELNTWKRLTQESKRDIFRYILMYFVNPLKPIKNVELKLFEMCGMKCETFQVNIDGLDYVFVPGQKSTILGWDMGAEGLRSHELLQFNEPLAPQKQKFSTFLSKESLDELGEGTKENIDKYDFTTLEGNSEYINDFTSSLRKADLPAALVMKEAVPVSSIFKGNFDCVTGNFEGNLKFWNEYKEKITAVFSPKLSAKESLSWSFPKFYRQEGEFYLEAVSNSDNFRVYAHQPWTYDELKKKVYKNVSYLLTEDHWEYIVGGGTRRLFRWGNDVAMQPGFIENQTINKIQQENMFGICLDHSNDKYELTDSEDLLKMGPIPAEAVYPIEQVLPFSSYYQSKNKLRPGEILAPEKYSYRSAILVRK